MGADANLGGEVAGLIISSATLATTASFDTARSVSLSGFATLDVAADTVLGLTGQVWGTGILIKTGAGTLTLSGTNTYFGGTAIEQGTVQVGADAALGYSAGGLSLTSATLATTATFDAARSVSLSGTGTFDVAAGTTLGLTSAVSGSGGLTKTGAGTLTLSGINTYLGGTAIEQGTLQVGADAALGDIAGGLTFNGGTLATTATFDTARTVNLSGTGTFDVFSNTVLGLTGEVSGPGGLAKVGAGTLILSGATSYAGGTAVSGGRLVGDAGSIRGDIRNAATVEFAQESDGSFAGNIGGLGGTNGSMVKSGAGVLTLTGTSTLPWTVAAGGLVSTTTLFTGDLTIAEGASMTFDQGFEGSYAGTLAGAGGLLFTGGGLVTLTGNASGFTGTSLVENFTLRLDGTLGGTVVLGDGGRLAGNGTVGSTTVQPGGTLAPGNSIGTINVAGNLVLQPGSTYEVETEPGGTAADLIHVTGTATLAGQVLHVGLDGTYAPQATYTILTADGGVAGTFDGVASTFAFLDPTLGYTATSVLLTLARNEASFPSVGQTPNQRAAAAGVESLGSGSTVYDAVVGLDAAGAAQAFDALSGEIHASLKTGLLEDSRFVREAALARLQALPAAGGANAPKADGNAADAPFAAWTQGFGSRGSTDGDGNAAGLDRDTAGLFIGGDARLGDTGRLGLLAGYQNSSYDAGGRAASADADSYHLGVYGGAGFLGLNLRGGAAYAWSGIDTARNVAFTGFSERLTGSTDARTAQLFGEAGYEIRTGWAAFEPFAGLAYVNVSTDGYTERGGAAALAVGGDTTEVTYSTLGVRASAELPAAFGSAKVSGVVGWRHAFDAPDPAAINALAGGAAFAVSGVPIAEDVAVIGAGLEFDLGAMPELGVTGAKLGLSYDGQFGSGVSENAAKARFTLTF